MNPSASSDQLATEIRRKKRFFWMLSFFALLLLGAGGFFFVRYLSADKDPIAKVVVYPQYRDIEVVIEEDGSVKKPRVLDLSFLVSGTLKRIEVEEGDKMKAGDFLASIDDTPYLVAIKQAKAQINNIYGQIKAQEAEVVDLEYREALKQYENAKKQKGVSVDEQKSLTEKRFSVAKFQAEKVLHQMKVSLETTEEVFGFNRYQKFPDSVFHNGILYTKTENGFQRLKRELLALNAEPSIFTLQSYPEILQRLERIIALAEGISQNMEDGIKLFANAVPMGRITESQIESRKQQLINAKTLLHQELVALITAKKDAEASLSQEASRTTSVENTLEQAEVALENAKKRMEQKRTTKEAALSMLYAQLASAKAALEKAEHDYRLTKLTAPVNGEVTEIFKEIGEIVGAREPVMRLLAEGPMIVEVMVEELDIAKITMDQEAEILIAAIPDHVFKGKVVYISNEAVEDENGVIRYLVRLALDLTEEEARLPIKEKMSVTVRFILDKKDHVLALPVDSIYEKDGKSFVLLAEDLRFVPIKTGITDGVWVKIQEGVTEKTGVIRNLLDFESFLIPPGDTQHLPEENAYKPLDPEIKAYLEEKGFSALEIKQIEHGNIDERLEEKLKAIYQEESGGFLKMIRGDK